MGPRTNSTTEHPSRTHLAPRTTPQDRVDRSSPFPPENGPFSTSLLRANATRSDFGSQIENPLRKGETQSITATDPAMAARANASKFPNANNPWRISSPGARPRELRQSLRRSPVPNCQLDCCLAEASLLWHADCTALLHRSPTKRGDRVRPEGETTMTSARIRFATVCSLLLVTTLGIIQLCETPVLANECFDECCDEALCFEGRTSCFLVGACNYACGTQVSPPECEP